MPLGPVFRHEMIAAGRRARLIVLRVALGALVLAWLVLAYAATASSGTLSIAEASALTSQFYASFAWITLLGVLTATPAMVAGAIATERERRTIEYLFATDLSNAEIVLDKLAARLLTVGQVVLAAVPILAIFRLLGGVPVELLATHLLTLTAAAAVSAGVSLVASTWRRRARDATPSAYVANFLLLFAPVPLGWLAMESARYAPWLSDCVLGPFAAATSLVNPIVLLLGAGGLSGGVLGVDLDPRAIALSVAAQGALAAACVALCVACVRRVHLAAAGRGPSAGKSYSAARRPPPCERDPMLWKERHATAPRRGGRHAGRWGTVGLALLLLTPAVVMLGRGIFLGLRVDPDDFAVTTAITVAIGGPLLALLAGVRAASAVTQERERDTWVSLLTTPLESAEIVRAKLRGAAWPLRWAVVALPLVTAAGAYLQPLLVVSALATAVTLAATMFTATGVGLWWSLRMSTSTKAVGATIASLVALGGGYLPFVFMFATAFRMTGEPLIICFSPCVPFLFAIPIVMVVDQSPEEMLPVAYGLGVLGYAALGAFVAVACTNRFDDLAPRTTARGGPLSVVSGP